MVSPVEIYQLIVNYRLEGELSKVMQIIIMGTFQSPMPMMVIYIETTLNKYFKLEK